MKRNKHDELCSILFIEICYERQASVLSKIIVCEYVISAIRDQLLLIRMFENMNLNGKKCVNYFSAISDQSLDRMCENVTFEWIKIVLSMENISIVYLIEDSFKFRLITNYFK